MDFKQSTPSRHLVLLATKPIHLRTSTKIKHIFYETQTKERDRIVLEMTMMLVQTGSEHVKERCSKPCDCDRTPFLNDQSDSLHLY